MRLSMDKLFMDRVSMDSVGLLGYCRFLEMYNYNTQNYNCGHFGTILFMIFVTVSYIFELYDQSDTWIDLKLLTLQATKIEAVWTT